VEDFIGAGAVVAALCGADAGLAPSPEAAAAGAAYASAAHDLDGALTESVSGRELRAMGKGDDIGWASALNVSRCVPVLGDDGVFRDEAA
jgi:2-phosphosulfolactate phosphatase